MPTDRDPPLPAPGEDAEAGDEAAGSQGAEVLLGPVEVRCVYCRAVYDVVVYDDHGVASVRAARPGASTFCCARWPEFHSRIVEQARRVTRAAWR